MRFLASALLRMNRNARRSLSKKNVGLSMGYTSAVNDALALSSVFSGSFRSTTAPVNGSLPPTRERCRLQRGMTWLLARGQFMEPGVTMRLGGENPDASISLNVAKTFQHHGAINSTGLPDAHLDERQPQESDPVPSVVKCRDRPLFWPLGMGATNCRCACHAHRPTAIRNGTRPPPPSGQRAPRRRVGATCCEFAL
jgi:hypothetical protein